MTREEAIEIIKAYKQRLTESASNLLDGDIEAFNIAIQCMEVFEKAKPEIRIGENKAYNADFTMGCEYAIGVIERMFEEVEE